MTSPQPETRKTVTYKVQGLDCAEEVMALRSVLGNEPGVLNLDFDILNARMTVEFNPARIAPDDIVRAVASTGMKALPAEETVKQKAGSFWQENGPFLMTCASGALMAAGFLSHWLIHGSLLHAIGIHEGSPHVFPTVSVLFYVASMVSGAWFVIPKAILAARRLRPDMNLLMTIAIVAAGLIGEWLEAAAVAFLFALALLLERWSIHRARRAVEGLMELSPTTARCVLPETGLVVEKRVEEVPVGTTVLVRPGEKIPLDGNVTRGFSTVNQAPITGESVPVPKSVGDQVLAGTINEDGALEFQVTRPASDTTLAHVIHLVQAAHARRAPMERWVDKFARYYTPVMIGIATGIAVLPPLVFSGSWLEWLYRALVVLVIACPCALVISTPVSIVSGLTSAARNGVLIKGGMFLEAPVRWRAIALDKTGTLTHGQPEVQKVIPLDYHSQRELLEIAATLESPSDHPVARAVLRKAKAEGVAPRSAENFQAIKGRGAQAKIEGRLFWIGNHRLMEEMGTETPDVHDRADQLEKSGSSVVAIGNTQHICGFITISDQVRTESPEVIRQMKQLGIQRVVMLTGDNEGTARTVASCIGVDDFMAELLPQDKLDRVESLVAEYGSVAMVGDGVNDAPAMAAATTGIAMGAAGSDAAIETADIALMADDLTKLPWLIRHSRRTLRVVRQNIAFAIGEKLLFLSLAVLGLASLWMAIAADMGASLLVISNGLRLLGRKAQLLVGEREGRTM
jgi:Cd2+/Zn2+-exporting ATPase